MADPKEVLRQFLSHRLWKWTQEVMRVRSIPDLRALYSELNPFRDANESPDVAKLIPDSVVAAADVSPIPFASSMLGRDSVLAGPYPGVVWGSVLDWQSFQLILTIAYVIPPPPAHTPPPPPAGHR